MESISIQRNFIPSKKEFSQFPYLREIIFDTIPSASNQMLIGIDVPKVLCVGNVQKGSKGPSYAMETRLRWPLLGPSMTLSSRENFHLI